jgi:hypothetical protein
MAGVGRGTRRHGRAGRVVLVTAVLLLSAGSAVTKLATAAGAVSPLKVFVGYADDIRANPVNFPTPWQGDVGVNFIGSNASWDAGAVMLENPNATPVSVDSVVVDLQRAGLTYNLWGSFSVAGHGTTVLTQSTQYDFDTSDAAPIESCGADAPPTLDPPLVTITVGGVPTTSTDSGHVLDTRGFDTACIGTGNESTQWTPIGKAPCTSGSTLTLAPAAQTLAPAGTASFTSKFSCGTTGLSGVPVQLSVLSGPNAGTTITNSTSSSGSASFSYSGSTLGVDTVQATVTNTAGTISSPVAHVVWDNATLSLNPAAGLPGDTIAFPAPSGTAQGYTPGESVTLHANSTSGPTLTTVIANGSGAISGSFVVPVPNGGGSLDAVVAVGATSGKQGWAVFSSPCTDNWIHPAGGAFETGANWSTGAVPGASDVACIILPGTYAVAATTNQSVAGLVLGTSSGSQTLDLNGGGQDFQISGNSTVEPSGVLALDSTDGNYSMISGAGTLTNLGTFQARQHNGGTRYIRVNVVNTTSGTTDIADFDTRIDSATSFVNNGAMTIGSGSLALSATGASFTQAAGTLAVPGSFSVSNGTFTMAGGTQSGHAVVLSSSTLNDSGGKGSLILQCGDTISGMIPAGQTIDVQGSACGGANASIIGSGLTNAGTLVLDSTDGNSALVEGAPLTNKAKLNVIQANGGQRYIRSNLTNLTSGTITVSDFDTRLDAATTTVNNGKITVTSTGGLSIGAGGAVLTQSGGTLANSGSFSVSAPTFNITGGTETGNPILVANSTITDSASGAGSFVLDCTNVFGGTIAATQTFTVQGNAACGGANLDFGSAVVSNGTLVLDTTNGSFAELTGSPLTNNGTVSAPLDTGGQRYFNDDFTNSVSGTVDIGDYDTRINSGTTTTNNGTFTIEPGGGVNLNGGAFVQSGGTLTVNGSMTGSNQTFTMSGGAEAGNPVALMNGTLTDSAGAGSFVLECSDNLGGTIPSGQTVTAQGNATCGSANVSLTGASVTNNGTLRLDSLDGSYALISGSPLTNAGTLTTVQDAGGTRYVRVTVTNSGTMSIGAFDSREDNGTATSNSGTLSVADGANLAMSNGSSYSQTSGGTLAVVVDVPAATGYGLTGGAVTLAGTLDVTTVGTPTSGTSFSVISGASSRSGTFATVSSAVSYTPLYSTAGVKLKAS